MKRFIIVLLAALFIPCIALADEYDDYLGAYDLSFFKDELGESYSFLEELGIDDFRFDSITSIKLNDILSILKNMFEKGITSPVKALMSIMIYIFLSALFRNIDSSGDEMSELYSTVSALIISLILIVQISPAISIASSSIGIASNFIYAFLPVFFAVSAAGGGLTTAFSTNSLLLVLSQALSFISGNIFLPSLNSFLAVSICAGLKSSLNLDKVVSGIKKALTSAVSVTAGGFVSVLSLKTAVASRADVLGIRSARFVINSVVPVVGGAISEGLVSIQSYSSLIKSSVGVVGIIGVALVFLPSLIELVIWRGVLFAAGIVADTFGDKSVSLVLNAFRDALLLTYVILVVSMLATVISIGILVAARTV